MGRPARFSGTSTRSPRKRTRAGNWRARRGWAARVTAAGSGLTPPIDPELGLLYVSAGNPFGDSKKRDGTNLFSNSIIALTLDRGIMKWYFQETHHDVWDYDTGAPATLFDMQVGGR